MVAVLRVLRQEHADLARLLDMVEAQLGGDGAQPAPIRRAKDGGEMRPYQRDLV